MRSLRLLHAEQYTYVAPDSRFPPTLWASAPTDEELPRTNNGCESFHSHLSNSFSGPHPNIYHFSNALLLYQTNTYIQLQNIRSQKLVKKQEGIRREFIKRTWASYTTGQISRKDYICKMCYKVSTSVLVLYSQIHSHYQFYTHTNDTMHTDLCF